MKTKRKHLPMSLVIFDPRYADGKKQKVDKTHPLKYGETVLYLGEVVNVPGHCAVAKDTGLVVWLLHPEDFRKAKESEL